MRGGAVVLMLALFLAACREEVMHDLDERQANLAKVALEDIGVSAEKKRQGSGWSIAVQGGDAGRALALLEERRIGRKSQELPGESSKSLVPGKEEREYVR